ncbi:hypothetical protein GMST_05070 [Geomonas silvestris]|uniref:Nucleotide modification associated domain-containing protein n=1 Tax=Geomonas silvestris TaxID=2740184 RepID=A0A6V8MDZ1_9BACT|nr:hypothetical protein [Geomonas silvestris]GFO58182.1 hypothetical protein GMST_05070 [Geomonas silvestris]
MAKKAIQKRSLYAVTYLNRSVKQPEKLEQTSPVGEFHASLSRREFPYDGGDDPSFFSASKFAGPITWGVCRPDVRGRLNPGDIVAFFSEGRGEYKFVAALEAECVISQTDIWAETTKEDAGRDKTPTIFRKYLNLLIRKTDQGWEHYEPALHPKEWHDDWVRRICKKNELARNYRDSVIAQAAHSLSVCPPPLPIAENYIVFSKKTSIVSRDPLTVATYSQGDSAEVWKETKQEAAIYRLIFRDTKRKLMTSTKPKRHRHFRRELDDGENFLAEMKKLVETAEENKQGIVAGAPTGTTYA